MQQVETAQGQGPDESNADEEDEGGVSYINPSMLLTQSSQTMDGASGTASGAANHRPSSHSFGFNNGNNNSSNAAAAVRPEIDLFESLSRVKQGAGALPVSSSLNTAKPNTSSSSSSSSSFSQEGNRKPAPPPAVAFSWNAKSIAPKPEPTPLSQSTKPTHKPSRSSTMNTSSLNATSSSSTYPINTTTTQLLNDTQQALGPHAFRAFEDIIGRMNSDCGQGTHILSSFPINATLYRLSIHTMIHPLSRFHFALFKTHIFLILSTFFLDWTNCL